MKSGFRLARALMTVALMALSPSGTSAKPSLTSIEGRVYRALRKLRDELE